MYTHYVSGHRSASHYPLDSLDYNCCVSAYEWGRQNDTAFFRGAWAPEEHLVRATEGCEFRGLMVREGFLGVPQKFGKYPRAVMVARRRGSRIERTFAALAPEFMHSQHLLPTLTQVEMRAAEWFADCRRNTGGKDLIFADAIEIGGLQ